MKRNQPDTLDEVISMMLGAETLEEIETAEGAAVRWMQQHPEDEEVIVQADEALETKRRVLGESGGGA